jgi:agmatine deiminase
MKSCHSILFALLLCLTAMAQAGSDDDGPRLADPAVIEALRATDTPGLPKNLTPGERPHLRLPDLSRTPRVPPVAAHLHTASEFDRNEAIIMRWGNFNSVLTEMIVPITTGDSLASVLLVVANSSQQSSAASTLAAAGANLNAVDFLIAPSDSVWIRDYGPRFSSADNERIIVDHEYNRPRPQDNQIPAAIASHLGEDLYDMPIAHGGGNFHLFANGQAYMTDLIVNENPATRRRKSSIYTPTTRGSTLPCYRPCQTVSIPPSIWICGFCRSMTRP